eukprot:scaffold840_cov344-Pavlova_lutheri.AAC.93
MKGQMDRSRIQSTNTRGIASHDAPGGEMFVADVCAPMTRCDLGQSGVTSTWSCGTGWREHVDRQPTFLDEQPF